MHLRVVHCATLIGASLAVAACRQGAPPPPPAAEFLLASGDSTFWVNTGPQGIRIRRSPLLLTAFDGRFYEVYVADDDRSFFDATFIGQRIYRRDLITNDSVAVFDDPVVPGFAARYAAEHPRERPLQPSDEGSENPATVVTSETDVIELVGPFLTFEQHTDLDLSGGENSHETQRGVVDLRRPGRATLASLFGEPTATRLAADGRKAFEEALDSVRAATDDRARLAAEAIGEFAFDPASFALIPEGGDPAIEFVVQGRGDRAGGFSLPLPPLVVPAGDWWAQVRRLLPLGTADSTTDEWRGPGYDVVARYDSSGEVVTVALRDSTNREWSLGRFPAPAHRLYRLDAAVDSTSRRAIARAFDEAVRYSGEARTASAGCRTAGCGSRLVSGPGRGSPGRSVRRPAARRTAKSHSTPVSHLPHRES